MRACFIAFLFIITGSPARAEAIWDFLYQEDGIKVYADRSTPPTYKAEGYMDADIIELMAVLADISRRTEWVKGLAETRVVAGDPEEHVWLYSRYDLPWPAEDRDSVIESVIHKDYKQSSITVDFKAVTHESVPPKAGVIRVSLADGVIFFKGVDAKKLFIRYQMQTDPGGSLPTWITNWFTKDVPVNTLRAMRAQVEKTRGQYGDFIKRYRLLQEAARSKQPL